MSQTVKAVRIEAFGGPEVMKFVDVAVGEPGPGEARIRHRAIGINFIDIYQRAGVYPNPLPLQMGMEGSGTVEAVGKGVTHIKVGDRVAYAIGYTGLGVASSRFGAEVMLDMIDGRKTPATQSQFVQSKPLPFPPEPFRFIGIQATRWSLNREDKSGKRNLWLRSLDRLGLGFDS
ncbi:MAG: hypothetical protein EBR53_08920 [Actinobacteria bacterium]|nr:hypothetical protein [Actinomycetota bacterium]